MDSFVIKRVQQDTSTPTTKLEKRRQKIRAIHGKAIMGYSPKEDLFETAKGIVSIECLGCRRAFLYDISDKACETKIGQQPCLGFTTLIQNDNT